MAESKLKCPDCSSAMQPIKLIDATDGPGWDAEGVQHVELDMLHPMQTEVSSWARLSEKVP